MEMKSIDFNDSIAKNEYKKAFKDLEPRTTYWDPLGWRIKGGVDLKSKFFEADKNLFEQFDRYQDQGFSVKESVEMVSKDLTTSGWSIPTYYVPDVFVVNPQRTPFADLAPRETIDSDTIDVTQQKGEFDPVFADEPTSYTERTDVDGKFETKSYDIYFYGFQSDITDKMTLASRSLRSAENAVENLHMKSMRLAEEKQIFRGTDATYGYDTSGFSGLPDMNTSYDIQKDPGSVSWKSDLRQLINDAESDGADRENLAVFVSFENWTNIANSLDDYTRFQDFGDELPFGFQSLEFDGVPIFKTKGIRDNDSLSANEPYVYAVNMGSVFMGMLRDVTMTPLAKTAPVEKMATDAYGALASEATPHIKYIEHT